MRYCIHFFKNSRIGELYQELVQKGQIVPQPEVPPPPVPMDYAWAREVSKINQFHGIFFFFKQFKILFSGWADP